MTRSDFSASNIYRRWLCPGSRAMESGLPEVRTDDSNEGTMLHRFAADLSQYRANLDPEQIETLERNEAMQLEFVEFVKREHGLDAAPQTHVEQEWWYHRDGKDLFPMHPDRVLVWPKVVIVFDSKFGREPVPAPNVNWQLKAYVCGAAERWDAEMFYGAITQPRFSRQIQSTVYSRDDVARARKEIEAVYDSARHLDAPRIPGLEQCKYCKGLALGVCHEARTLALSVRAESALTTSPEQVLSKMDPEARARLFEAFAMARRLDKTFTEAAKVLVAKDPCFIPGWKLVPGGERETVSDPMTLFVRLSKLGVTADEFVEICTTPKKKLVELVRAKTKLKGKELSLRMDLLLAGVVDATPIAPSLERTAA